MSCGGLKLDEIRDGLDCRRVGKRIELVDSVTSTNDRAWDRFEGDAADGLVILAEHQSRGRGRFGRAWESPRGASVLCSVVIVDKTDALKGGTLGLICSVAAYDAMRSETDVPVGIRWPNDLMINNKKAGGVLVESRPRPPERNAQGPAPGKRPKEAGRVFVVGIGINCLQHAVHFPPDLQDRATSLDMESPHPVHRARLCRALLQGLDRWLAAPEASSPGAIRDAWLQRAVGLGHAIRLRHAGHEYAGVVIDVDPTADLVVQLDNGGRRLFPADTTTVLDFPDRVP